MSKQVYISADYDLSNGDRDVVNELNKWGSDDLHMLFSLRSAAGLQFVARIIPSELNTVTFSRSEIVSG